MSIRKFLTVASVFFALAGLGYAANSSQTSISAASSPSVTAPTTKVVTKVIHKTVHVKAKKRKGSSSARSGSVASVGAVRTTVPIAVAPVRRASDDSYEAEHAEGDDDENETESHGSDDGTTESHDKSADD